MAKVVVGSSFVAQYPQGGGVFSVVLQYVQGLRRLGCEVCWLELLWPGGADDQALIRTFAERVADMGLERNFCLLYFPQGRWPETGRAREWYGWSAAEFEGFCGGADLLLDLCASVRPPDLLAATRRVALVDLDPGFMQLWIQQGLIDCRAHDLFFTVGQNIGRPGCPIPHVGVEWRSFWPPVDLELWKSCAGSPDAPFSTVSQWWGDPPTMHEGEVYDGSKRTAFLRFIDLPVLARHPIEVALNVHPDEVADRQLLRQKGWQLSNPHEVAGDFRSYRAFVQRACAEFSVAKPGYVKSRSGWFSDRSACYLAAGRPVLVEDTGFSAFLPTGSGVLAFATLSDAADGAAEIRQRYRAHASAAREIAREYFAAEKVLRGLLTQAGL